jgi:tRNA threonylcarbamoyladenosine biosynthesis protein TsaB
MLLISIDTSGRNGSVALCRGDVDTFETLQLGMLEGGTYSARLMPSIASLLHGNGVDKAAVNGFVVVSGPGSFTGLRVGLATVKGLCEALHRPLVAISMLEALALTYGIAGQHPTIMLDAGRNEVYVGEYEVLNARATCLREYLVKLEGIAAADRLDNDILTTDTKIADALRARGMSPRLEERIHADQIGRLGLTKLQAGDTVDPATVDVNYIRRSDAELFSAPKR